MNSTKNLVLVNFFSLDKEGNEEENYQSIFIAVGYAKNLIIKRFEEEAIYNNTTCGIDYRRIVEMLKISVDDCVAYDSMQPYADRNEFEEFKNDVQELIDKLVPENRYRIKLIVNGSRIIEPKQPTKKAEQKWYDRVTRLLKK